MRGADGTLLQRLLGMRCVCALVVAGSFEQRLRDGQDRHIRDTGYRIQDRHGISSLGLEDGWPDFLKARREGGLEGKRDTTWLQEDGIVPKSHVFWCHNSKSL